MPTPGPSVACSHGIQPESLHHTELAYKTVAGDCLKSGDPNPNLCTTQYDSFLEPQTCSLSLLSVGSAGTEAHVEGNKTLGHLLLVVPLHSASTTVEVC